MTGGRDHVEDPVLPVAPRLAGVPIADVAVERPAVPGDLESVVGPAHRAEASHSSTGDRLAHPDAQQERRPPPGALAGARHLAGLIPEIDVEDLPTAVDEDPGPRTLDLLDHHDCSIATGRPRGHHGDDHAGRGDTDRQPDEHGASCISTTDVG